MGDQDKVVFSDFLLAYAKTRPTISPETIQVEAQTLYTRLLDNPDSLKVCYVHFQKMGSQPDAMPRKRKRVPEEQKPKPRKKSKANDDAVVDLTNVEVEPKYHVTRSRAKRSVQIPDPVHLTEQRASKWVGVLPKGLTQWMGVVRYKKKANGRFKEKRTPGCATELDSVQKIQIILKKIRAKGYTLDRDDYGKRLAAGRQQVKPADENKKRKNEHKKRTNDTGSKESDVVIETECPKTSKYIGVHWDCRVERWLASIPTDTPSKRLLRGGYFKDQTKAAKKVNELCVRNGISPLNPSLCVSPGSQNEVVQAKRSRYVGIIYSPERDQWTCDLKYQKPNGKRIFRVENGEGLWDRDEEELVKYVTMEVFRLKQEGFVMVDFEYGTKKLTTAPESKYIGIEFDIDHGRWACWIQYKQPHSDIISTKFIGYHIDQDQLAKKVRAWVSEKKSQSKTTWNFVEEYGINKLELERRQLREAEAQRGDKDLYEVERIIEWKITPEGRVYHVKWASADDEYTWEPEDHVQHLELFRQFHKRHIERIQKQRELELQRKKIKPSNTFSSTLYKGVNFDIRDGRWHATFTVGRKTLQGGAFDDENEAAKAVNDLCKSVKKAVVNKITTKTSQLLWIQTNGLVYFPTNRTRRSLRPECIGEMPELEADSEFVAG